MGKALVPSLPEGTKKAYVVVEFIVDADGTPVNRQSLFNSLFPQGPCYLLLFSCPLRLDPCFLLFVPSPSLLIFSR